MNLNDLLDQADTDLVNILRDGSVYELRRTHGRIKDARMVVILEALTRQQQDELLRSLRAKHKKLP